MKTGTDTFNLAGFYSTIPFKLKEMVLFLLPAAEGLYRRPLLLALMGLTTGIVIRQAAVSPATSAAILLPLTLCCGAIIPQHKILAGLIPLLALAGSFLVDPWVRMEKSLPLPFSSETALTGRVTKLSIHGNDIRCVLRDLHLEKDNLPPPLSGIRLIIKGGHDLSLSEGMRVSATCQLRAFTNFNNPGRFDYRRHMAHRGIAAWTKIKAHEATLLPGGTLGSWRVLLYKSRQRINAAIKIHAPTPRSQALLSALITGERSGISPPTRDLFTQTGTAHLLAISGLHLGIVTTLFFFFFKHLFSLWSGPLIKGHTQKMTAMATLLPVLLYALLSGLGPSTQRALMAATLVLGALTLYEEVDLPTTLALAALIILIVHPPALFSVSFQLSFAAVTAIFAGLSQQRKKTDERIPPSVTQRAGMFLIPPWFASLGTAPLVWHHFGYAAPVGLLANLVVVPMASVGVVLPGLIGVLLLPLSATLAGLFFCVAGHAAESAMGMASLFSMLPGGFLILPRPTPTTTALVLVPLFSLLLSQPHRRKGPIAISFCCLVLLILTAFSSLEKRYKNPNLRITVLDVGQGSAAVVDFPNGKRWLVDGGFARPNGYDIGRYAVAPYLQKAQVISLDAVVLSHPESDHMGGLIHILNYFAVEELLTSPHRGKGELWNLFCEAASRAGAPEHYFTAQSTPKIVEGVHVSCLHPPGPRACFTGKGAANNNSLVLLLTYGHHRFLLTGDIMEKAESRLVKKSGQALHADVLVVPHHGSATSSTPEFIGRVRPAIAVVSVGSANRYGLPNEQVLSRYSRAGSALYRTDHHGAVIIESDGVTLSTRTFLSPPP